MLCASAPGGARIAGLRQHAGVPPGDVASRAAGDLAELAARHDRVTLVLGHALAGLWPDAAGSGRTRPRVRVTGTGQPSTEVWWGVIDELAAAAHAGLLVAADYDRELNYLSVAAFET
jgi:hypothetical protein